MPDYKEKPGWNGTIEKSKDFIWDNGLRFLRYYQKTAIHKLQEEGEETEVFVSRDFEKKFLINPRNILIWKNCEKQPESTVKFPFVRW